MRAGAIARNTEPMALSDTSLVPPDFRTQVVAESIRLFSEQGYESTTVEQIAAAAGVSRRTLFRQFRSKEDMIFADHESLLAQVADRLSGDDDAPDAERTGDDPWTAVCSAAEIVFIHFRDTRDLAVRRLHVVANVPALRDRELVTTYRYQRIFEDYLRRRLPGESRVRIVGYAAAITSAHNYMLRSMIRGDDDATLGHLRIELSRIRRALGGGVSNPVGVSVVTYAPGTPSEEIVAALREQLHADGREQRQ